MVQVAQEPNAEEGLCNKNRGKVR